MENCGKFQFLIMDILNSDATLINKWTWEILNYPNISTNDHKEFDLTGGIFYKGYGSSILV